MKVLYDHYIFTQQRFGGISRYIAALRDNMPQAGIDTEVATLFSSNVHMKGRCMPLADPKKARLLYVVQRKLNRNYSRLRIRNAESYDILHPTYYAPYDLKDAPRNPTVLTIHDMTDLKFNSNDPHRRRDIQWQRDAICRADCLIAISEHTKKDLLESFDLDPTVIRTIPHGLMLPPHIAPQRPSGLPEGDYILFVGTRLGYKNFRYFIAEALPVAKKYGLRIVCAGSTPFDKEESALIGSLGGRDRVFQMFCSESELRWLYRNAVCFVFPSLYEGFGLPILEAFDAGCPQLLADATSLPEVGGDAALYFDAGRDGALVAQLEHLLDDTDLRSQLSEKGKQRLEAHFTLQQMIDKTADLYRSML